MRLGESFHGIQRQTRNGCSSNWRLMRPMPGTVKRTAMADPTGPLMGVNRDEQLLLARSSSIWNIRQGSGYRLQ